MTKSERLTARIETLEREYRSLLTQALTDCAAGRWGLFGHNEHLSGQDTPAELARLQDLARTIDQQRARTGEPPFALHQTFEIDRGPADPNAPGEPKQAQAWLQRLADI